jgi:hypothetical protein
MAKKLSEKQWEDILKRHIIDGVGSRALSIEYKVPESSIRSRAKSAQSAQIKTTANQIVEVSQNISELNPFAQSLTFTLASRLRNISSDLAEAAEIGAGISKRLSAIAAGQSLNIDFNNPLESMDELKSIEILSRLSNDSSKIGLNLLAANKDQQQIDPVKSKTIDDFYAANS